MQTSPESKWTRGPWTAHTFMVKAGREVVTQTGYSSSFAGNPARSAEAEANAHLIASAPDMAEALEAAPIRSKYHGVNGFEEARFFEDYDAFMAKRHAALSKAEGR